MEPLSLPPATNLWGIFCLVVLYCFVSLSFYPFINLSGASAIKKIGWAGTQFFRFESKVPILKNAFLARANYFRAKFANRLLCRGPRRGGSERGDTSSSHQVGRGEIGGGGDVDTWEIGFLQDHRSKRQTACGQIYVRRVFSFLGFISCTKCEAHHV